MSRRLTKAQRMTLRRQVAGLSNDELAARANSAKQIDYANLYFQEIRRRVRRSAQLASPGGIFHQFGPRVKPPQRIDPGQISKRDLARSMSQQATTVTPQQALRQFRDSRAIRPAFAFVDTNDAAAAFNFYRAVAGLYEEVGVDHEIADIQRGSIRLDFTAWMRKGVTNRELKKKLKEVQDNAEMYAKAHARRGQAEIDAINAGVIHNIVSSVSDETDISTTLGQLYIVRGKRPDGTPFLVAGQMSADEAAFVDKNPQVRSNPWLLMTGLESTVQLESMAESQPAIDGDPPDEASETPAP